MSMSQIVCDVISSVLTVVAEDGNAKLIEIFTSCIMKCHTENTTYKNTTFLY